MDEGYWQYRNVYDAGIWSLYADDHGVIRDADGGKIYRGVVERRWIGPWESFQNPKRRSNDG